MDYQPVVPQFEHLFKATVTLLPPAVIGKTPPGERRMIPITGGTFTGKKLSGKILPGGADWQIIHPDGSATLDAHYLLQTDDGALIYIHNHGFRNGPPEILQKLAAGENVDPASYYFRTSPVFETGFPKYSWLNTIVGICSAVRKSDAVIIDFYAVQ
jgi:hypothetical protein